MEVELRRNDLHVSEQAQLKLMFAGLQEIQEMLRPAGQRTKTNSKQTVKEGLI